MLTPDTAPMCRVCKECFLTHEIKDNPVGKRGICFQCLLREYNKLKLLLKEYKAHGKKKNRFRKK